MLLLKTASWKSGQKVITQLLASLQASHTQTFQRGGPRFTRADTREDTQLKPNPASQVPCQKQTPAARCSRAPVCWEHGAGAVERKRGVKAGALCKQKRSTVARVIRQRHGGQSLEAREQHWVMWFLMKGTKAQAKLLATETDTGHQGGPSFYSVLQQHQE